MHTDENSNLNGWQNIGKVSIWVLDKLQGSELHLYLMLVRKTVGYSQYTSDFLPQPTLAKLTGLSIRSVERVLPKLIDKGYILRVSTNAEVTGKGKLPYKYQLNMKLDGFPSLGKLKKLREDAVPKPDTVEPYGLQFTYLDSTKQGNVYQPARKLGGKLVELLTTEFAADCKARNVDTSVRERELKLKESHDRPDIQTSQ